VARWASGGGGDALEAAALVDVSPGLYRTVADYHQRELRRLNGLDDIVYRDLQKREGPVHQRWLSAIRRGEPVIVPTWALTDYDNGAGHLGEWVRQTTTVAVWPDDRVTFTPAATGGGRATYVDPCVWRTSWELAGHKPRPRVPK
jgi:hypothetical protein